MATPAPPNGWKVDGTTGYLSSNYRPIKNGNYFQVSVDNKTGNRIIYEIGPQLSTGITNQVTNQSFDIGGTRRLVMSVDSNGKVTKGEFYSGAENAYGKQGIDTLISSSKQSSISLLRQTGATAAVKESREFKSSLGNAATLNSDGTSTESSNGTGDASTASLDRLSDLNVSISDSPGKVRQSYSKNLKYPADLDTTRQDYVMVNMYRYVPTPLSASQISTGGGLNRSGRAFEKRNSIGQCILPIQGQVSDTNTVDWSGGNLTPIQAMAAAASYSTIIAGGQGADLAVEGASKMIKDNKGDIQQALATYFAGEAASAQNLLARTSGAIINPNMELLFNGPQLRQFTLSFRMTPRNRADVDNVRKIIRFFKQGMSVKQSSSELFLKSPNTFRVQYINSGKDHPYIGKIKECALLNCTVNYVPEGTYMTFAEVPSMTAYDMQLTFTELTPLYDGDYGNDDNNVGY
jgi:hypothetical protein